MVTEIEKSQQVKKSADGRALETDSGLPIKEFYSSADVKGSDEEPGEYPYTRGISPGMYRDRLWHMDLYAGFGNAEDARGRYEFLLEQGASGVNIALDLPTQLGYDSDNVMVKGEVGKVGLAVDTLKDLEDVFKNLPLDKAEIVFTVANGIGPIAMAWFIAVADLQGLRPEDYVIHLQNDPLKEYTGRGAFVLPIEASVRLAADVVEYTARQGYRHWKPIGICGSQYRWGGANAIHEIAFGLCEAIAYLEELTGRGLDVDSFAPMLEMHLTADIDIFEEAAKFRAARRVWAQILKERFGAKDPESCQLKISLYTAGYRLTKREPLNNSVRIALQALAAALGGVQHLGTLSMDEALSTPSEEAVKLAVRTQQILGYEARVGHVADPLGGSYYVEHLTDEIEEQVWHYIKEVDELGGAIVAVRTGYFQKFMDDGAYQFERDIESGDRFVVGVNSFQDPRADQAGSMKPFKIANAVEVRQIERLSEVRANRSQFDVDATLSELRDIAAKHENVVPPLIKAVKAYATVGEICDVFRDLFGTYEDEQIVL